MPPLCDRVDNPSDFYVRLRKQADYKIRTNGSLMTRELVFLTDYNESWRRIITSLGGGYKQMRVQMFQTVL